MVLETTARGGGLIMPNRRHHPQVIRAKELACAAGLDPYARIEHKDSWRRDYVYQQFMKAAFEERFVREAVDNIYWNTDVGSWYTDRWDIPRDNDYLSFSYGRCKSGHRWFWTVRGRIPGEKDYSQSHGWADTEAQALLDEPAMRKQLKRLAVETDRSIEALVRDAIAALLARQQRHE
jgi:hypothetical protein